MNTMKATKEDILNDIFVIEEDVKHDFLYLHFGNMVIVDGDKKYKSSEERKFFIQFMSEVLGMKKAEINRTYKITCEQHGGDPTFASVILRKDDLHPIHRF